MTVTCLLHDSEEEESGDEVLVVTCRYLPLPGASWGLNAVKCRYLPLPDASQDGDEVLNDCYMPLLAVTWRLTGRRRGTK